MPRDAVCRFHRRLSAFIGGSDLLSGLSVFIGGSECLS
jgi:hypothetical protein